MKQNKFWAAVGAALAVLAPGMAVVAIPSAHAQTYSVLYAFKGTHDGASPNAGLIRDKNGNLYGMTAQGGRCRFCGVVFELNAQGRKKVLYKFSGGVDGGLPLAGLVRDSDANLYGTTELDGDDTAGVVFKLDKTGTETVLHSFTGGVDGGFPEASLVRDHASNLYGTTTGGGAYDDGVVFKVDTTGAETVLYTFTGGADGSDPFAGLVRDSAGNLYGTAAFGGAHDAGVVFELKSNGNYKPLHSFTGGAGGATPYGGVVRDSAGNLYGTTTYGGAHPTCGVVFKLDATGTYTVLHNFTCGADGGNPFAVLVRDSAGNLYGTTSYNGTFGNGVVFKLDTAGAYTVLHSFDGTDGSHPEELVRDLAGNLYGTTGSGGAYDKGVVFKIAP
jgi:uncharacterized repeat protein (TIGR03803 family)